MFGTIDVRNINWLVGVKSDFLFLKYLVILFRYKLTGDLGNEYSAYSFFKSCHTYLKVTERCSEVKYYKSLIFLKEMNFVIIRKKFEVLVHLGEIYGKERVIWAFIWEQVIRDLSWLYFLNFKMDQIAQRYHIFNHTPNLFQQTSKVI